MIAVQRACRLTIVVLVLAALSACAGGVDQVALRAAVGDRPVVLLSTEWCGYCRKLRADLEAWNVAYAEIDVEHSESGQRAYELVRGRGVPILLVGEHVVHGYAPQRTRERLAAAGLLVVTQ